MAADLFEVLISFVLFASLQLATSVVAVGADVEGDVVNAVAVVTDASSTNTVLLERRMSSVLDCCAHPETFIGFIVIPKRRSPKAGVARMVRRN